jgi:thiazole synthase
MKDLIIAGQKFGSRLFLGTGKFSSSQIMRKSVIVSGTELVTVALKRIDPGAKDDGILSCIPKGIRVMINTAGARNAKEAVRIAEFAGSAGFDWIKLEIHPDQEYLLPDPVETLAAAELLVKNGFKVLPYINADPVLAKRLEDAGVHAVMPLGSPIGSNQGLKTELMLKIIIEQCSIPVVVDAGIGLPSHASAAIEMGASAVLVNTAIASSDNPVLMAEAFACAVKAAEMAIKAVPPLAGYKALATSPLNIF